MRFLALRLRVLHTSDHPEVADQYYAKHAEVLRAFGIGAVSSLKPNMRADPTIYMVVIELVATGELIAGMQLDIASLDSVPVEERLRGTVPELGRVVLARISEGVAEACGIWVRRDFAKLGLLRYLLRAGVAVAPTLGLTHLVGIANEFSKPTIDAFGFVPVESVVNRGVVCYPDERYPSTIMELNCRKLKSTPSEERSIVLGLRETPVQVSCHQRDDVVVVLEYDLRVSSGHIPLR